MKTPAEQIPVGFRFPDGAEARGDAVSWPDSKSVVVPVWDGNPAHHPYGTGALPERTFSRGEFVAGQHPFEQRTALLAAANALDAEAQARWTRAETRREGAAEARRIGVPGAADAYRREADAEDRRASELAAHADAIRPLAGQVKP